MSKLTMKKSGETDLVVTRRFAAPPEAIYRAHLDADMLKRWMLGPDGWTMPVCNVDPTEGGAFSYTWENTEDGERFTIFGNFLSLTPPSQIIHEETMDMGDDTPPKSRVVTKFDADGDGTLMTMTITYDSSASREAAISSGMEAGMAVSYDNLDAL